MADETVCFCFEVSKQTLIDIIREHKTATVEEVQKYCQASMGCGSCRKDIEALIAQELPIVKRAQ